MPRIEDEKLNADAVYAALVFVRDYAKSAEGQAAYREILERKSEKVAVLRSLASETSATLNLIPRFEYSTTLFEDIYAGEPESVELGLEFGRSLVWGSVGLKEMAASMEGPAGEAVRRFLADEAH